MLRKTPRRELSLLRNLRRHLLRNTVAYVALFFALSGSAIATGPVVLFKGDPAGGDLTGIYPDPLIGDGKVTSAKLADGSVTSGKLAEGVVTSGNLAPGAVPSAPIAGLEVEFEDGSVGSGRVTSAEAACDKGKKVIGGGFLLFNNAAEVLASAPWGIDHWIVIAHGRPADTQFNTDLKDFGFESTTENTPFRAYAVCADVPSD
jgi:hypothetical protein